MARRFKVDIAAWGSIQQGFPRASKRAAMFYAIPFPDISPALFSIDFGGFHFALRWYALAYIAGFLIAAWMIGRHLRKSTLWRNATAPMSPEIVEPLLTWMVLGVILGGRLGYVLFYQPSYYLQNPAEILQVWQGGMSFHGGFLGVVIAGLWFCRVHKVSIASLADLLALATPPALFLGRSANFINAELWGRPTDAPWGVIFPGAAAQDCSGPVGIVMDAGMQVCARHPSQLYEALLEGLILGLVILYVIHRQGALRVPGQVAGLFLAGYGVGRFIVEYFRQPDAQFFLNHPRGYALWLSDDIGLSMGQILSLPMVIVGLAVILVARQVARRKAGA